MFDLKREVAAWSAQVHQGRCRTAEEIAELTDHLYCEIERARTEGLGEEEAFHAAIAKLGSTTQLSAEHAKNRSKLSAILQYDCAASSPEQRRILLGHALIWASLQIASALIVAGRDMPEMYGWFSITAVFPLWWASDRLLRTALKMNGRAAR